MFIKKIHSRAILLIIAAILLLPACASATTEEQPEPNDAPEIVAPTGKPEDAPAPPIEETISMDPVTLKVLTLSFISWAPYYIAQEEGYFADQNIEIEFVEIRQFEDAIPLLATGELDVAAGTIRTSIYNGIAGGLSMKIVADKSFIDPNGCSYFALMVSPNLMASGELDSPAGVAGRRIVYAPEGSSGYYLEKLIGPEGLSVDDVTTENVSPPARGEALANGTVDMVITAEPWITRFIDAGQAVLWNPAEEVLGDFQLGFMMYGPTLLDENPDAGKRFMIAYLQGVQQFSEGKTERNLEILNEALGLDNDLLTKMCWPSFRTDGSVNLDSLLDYQAWAVDHGFIETPISGEELWDSSFIDYANSQMGN